MGKVLPLVLGTVQLGLEYGIANKSGRPDIEKASEIVNSAWSAGVREFDTAQDYGESERVLGRVFRVLGISPLANVISKIDPAIDHKNRDEVFRSVRESLDRLGVESLSGLLLHDEKLLDLWDSGIGVIMSDMVKEGLVKRIGVSVYSPDRAAQALSIPQIDIVQVPSNILDRRFENMGIFERIEGRRAEVYVRSVFLQGLLLMDTAEVPTEMMFAVPELNKLGRLCAETGLTRQELAVAYMRFSAPDAKLVMGVESAGQLSSNIGCLNKKIDIRTALKVRSLFSDVGVKLLNPSLWRLKE